MKSLFIAIALTFSFSAQAFDRLEAMKQLFAGEKLTNAEYANFPDNYFMMGGSQGQQITFCNKNSTPQCTAAAVRIPAVEWSIWLEKIPVTSVQVGNAVASEAKKAVPTLTDAQASSIASGVKSVLGF